MTAGLVAGVLLGLLFLFGFERSLYLLSTLLLLLSFLAAETYQPSLLCGCGYV